MADEEEKDEAEETEETSETEETESAEDSSDEELEDIEESMTEEGEDEPSVEDEEDTEPTKPVVKSDDEYYGTGRRKESVARVWIEAGEGNMTVNDRDVSSYFNNRARWIQSVWEPLEVLNFTDDINVWATLDGGGLTGQADALQLGIARALVEMDENARTFLKQEGLLTRDDRELERKKINQPGARAKQQVSKR
jgi:small subunit ribosomal protein S9